MTAPNTPNSDFSNSLPQDVQDWLHGILGPDEYVAACLLGDIMPAGGFGECWNFLTNRRFLVVVPDAADSRFRVDLELPVDELQEAKILPYVGSNALVLRDSSRGYETARFSMASHHEALDLVYYIETFVRERENEKSFDEIKPPATKRPDHRCSKCGRALGRWSEICPHCIDRRQTLIRVFSHVLPYKRAALLGLALTLTLTGLQLAPPYLIKVLIDDVITPRDLSLLPVIIGILIGAHVGAAVISVFRSYVMHWVGNRVLFDMRTELFAQLQLLRLRFYNQRQTGRIMSRVTSDLNRLQYFVAEGFQQFLVNIVTMLLIAGILVSMNGKLFLLALSPTPLIVISTLVFGHWIHKMYHRIWRRMAGLNAILADTIPGIRVVKAFAQERRESRRFEERSRDLFGQEMQAVKLMSGFFPLLQIQTTLGSILIFSVEPNTV